MSGSSLVNSLYFRIQESYRNRQTVRESLFETILKDKTGHETDDKMSQLRGRITSFAFNRIRFEYINLMDNKADPDHVSHVDPTTGKCLCELRRAYRLPCRHRIARYDGPIPLAAVHRRWHIMYQNGRG